VEKYRGVPLLFGSMRTTGRPSNEALNSRAVWYFEVVGADRSCRERLS
jgi:hypothetical protein